MKHKQTAVEFEDGDIHFCICYPGEKKTDNWHLIQIDQNAPDGDVKKLKIDLYDSPEEVLYSLHKRSINFKEHRTLMDLSDLINFDIWLIKKLTGR